MDQRLAHLFNRWFDGLATDEEKDELMRLVQQQPGDGHLAQLMQDAWETYTPGELPLTAGDRSTILQQILGQKETMHALPRKRKWRPYAIAAIITGLALSGYFLFFNKNEKPNDKTVVQQTPVSDVQPGTNGAILTLADGKKLVLDSLGNGVVASQNGADVLLQNGKLVYTTTTTDRSLSNTMTTPKGRQFSLVMADGSKVWLNAASSITYPTAFVEKERKVSITGEAYFEIAQDAAHPFKVSVNGMEVAVLGTQFNINAYNDEAQVKTTLLQGSIKVVAGKEAHVLKPGQQAQLGSAGNFNIVNDANTEEATGWKAGYFYFEKADVQTVMRQLARWYDLDVVYEGKQTEELFVGKLERNLALSQVFKIIKSIGVKYRLEGKKLYVRS